ncbi:MAG TPA: glycosyltransferase family 4 protein [Candidatus Limnocylindrales bacterium]|nr:glycosyltransferase family 4 protein [Candidatus Limnocylindrales bacterium]
MALRVGLLHYTAPPVVGGVEAVLGRHARLLADAGHSVRIIAGRGRSGDPRIDLFRVPLADTRHPAIRIARAALDSGRVPADFDGLVDELEVVLRAAVAGLDVLVVHNACGLHFNLPLTAALRRIAGSEAAPPLVAWQHDLAWASDHYRRALHPGEPWNLLRVPWPRTTYVTISAARHADQVRLAGLPPASVHVVPNGIDLDRLLGLHPATRRLVDALGLAAPGVWPVLLMPVRITPRKNLEMAVRVLAALRSAGTDARLVVTGPADPHAHGSDAGVGGLRVLAEQLGVSAAVHLLAIDRGRRTPTRVVTDLFRVADVLLLPSRDEGFGLPVLEAAVSRLPIVCADLPTLREVAGDDATYFHPDAHPEQVAALVVGRLEADPAARLATRARAGYGWDAIYATRIEPLLIEVATRR